MEPLVKKYADKLIKAKLGSPKGVSQPLVGGLDDTIVWNRKADEIPVLEDVFKALNINSLLFLKPREPYGQIISYLGKNALEAGSEYGSEKGFEHGLIQPKDCETKTFLHDLPVISEFNSSQIVEILKKRKGVIIVPKESSGIEKGPAVAAHGAVSPEQGFVTISSICFACFVKFFADYLENLQRGAVTDHYQEVFDAVVTYIKPLQKTVSGFTPTPFSSEEQVYSSMIEAGRKTIEYGLVDSYFGNLSYCWNDTLYISQTGSSMDELEGCIDPVPLDGSTSACLTASSELSAHVKIIEKTGCKAVLHGHPKFSVILSMDCDPKEKAACKFSEQCHIKCIKKRFAGTTPIVPGEVGTGRFGLCNTLPRAFEQSSSAIVYGHGLFTTGKNSFAEAFETMVKVENNCFNTYFEKINSFR